MTSEQDYDYTDDDGEEMVRSVVLFNTWSKAPLSVEQLAELGEEVEKEEEEEEEDEEEAVKEKEEEGAGDWELEEEDNDDYEEEEEEEEEDDDDGGDNGWWAPEGVELDDGGGVEVEAGGSVLADSGVQAVAGLGDSQQWRCRPSSEWKTQLLKDLVAGEGGDNVVMGVPLLGGVERRERASTHLICIAPQPAVNAMSSSHQPHRIALQEISCDDEDDEDDGEDGDENGDEEDDS